MHALRICCGHPATLCLLCWLYLKANDLPGRPVRLSAPTVGGELKPLSPPGQHSQEKRKKPPCPQCSSETGAGPSEEAAAQQ